MGVPSFFHWLVSRFEELIIYKDYPFTGHAIDYLFLDFNCAIHPAVKKDPLMKPKDMNQAVADYLDQIVGFVKPTSTVYIAIDGVAPRAKMEQQKDRRYKSVKLSKARRTIQQRFKQQVRETPVDFNMISPGTDFMLDLSSFLVDHIKARQATDSLWAGLTVVFSDATVPGEGEHKIMDYIRAHPEIKTPAIYGLDSDLIFLTMLNCGPNTVLVRESSKFERGRVQDETSEELVLKYLSIDHLKQHIARILSPIVTFAELEGVNIFNQFDFKPPDTLKTSHYQDESDNQRLIVDYCFFCLLLGNDFIPNLPSLRIREGGLTTVIQAYKIVSWQTGSYLVNRDGLTVNLKFFSQLLNQLVGVEDDFLLDYNRRRDIRVSKYNTRAKRVASRPNMDWELEDLEYIENKCEDIVRMGEPGWRVRYYQYHFNLQYRHKSQFQRCLEPICHQYLMGMKWTLYYYQGKHHNWSWHYPYTAAPSVVDLLDQLNQININELELPLDSPVKPFVQLMCILPPESSQLLPEAIARKMTSADSEFHDIYPVDVKLDLLGKKFLWECHAMLPDIDIARVARFVDKVLLQNYSDDLRIQARNRLGTDLVFKSA